MGISMHILSFAFAFSEYFFENWCSAGDNDNGIYVDYLRGFKLLIFNNVLCLAPVHAHLVRLGINAERAINLN